MWSYLDGEISTNQWQDAVNCKVLPKHFTGHWNNCNCGSTIGITESGKLFLIMGEHYVHPKHFTSWNDAFREHKYFWIQAVDKFVRYEKYFADVLQFPTEGIGICKDVIIREYRLLPEFKQDAVIHEGENWWWITDLNTNQYFSYTTMEFAISEYIAKYGYPRVSIQTQTQTQTQTQEIS